MNEELSFWDGVEKINGKKLSAEERLQFCEDFSQMLRTSPELAKIFFNTMIKRMLFLTIPNCSFSVRLIF